MDQQYPQDAAEARKKGSSRVFLRRLSIVVVAFGLLGSLLVAERADTPASAPERHSASASLGESLAISHRNRPHRPTNVDEAVTAARYAARQVQAAIDRVDRHEVTPERVDQACAFLLEARATFLVRIDILIDMVPEAEDELLDIQAQVLERIDAALARYDCPVSG